MELIKAVQGVPEMPVSVFTPERVRQLAAANSAARRLRDLGLRVISEDVFPDDAGAPILGVALSGWARESLCRLCDVSTWHARADVLIAHFEGVRLLVFDGSASSRSADVGGLVS